MNHRMLLRMVVPALLAAGLISCGSTRDLTPEATTPAVNGLMGDWQGYKISPAGVVSPLAVQVIAYGGELYEATVLEDFVHRDPARFVVPLRREGDALSTTEDPGFRATVRPGIITGTAPRGRIASFTLRPVTRLSPTLGAQPPAGAVVLFDGTDLTRWKRAGGPADAPEVPAPWKLVDGAMEVAAGKGSIVTKKGFTDFVMHLEFRTPFMPTSRGQARGNSGVYLQGRYEVQVLDSYGLTGEDNECGGIYKVAHPRVNMCAPPGQWQTYDIAFRAPRFDAQGTKLSDAVVTVRHNGVLIHENLTIPGPTGGALDERPQEPGGICLQDHGDAVQYRNIWLVETGGSGQR